MGKTYSTEELVSRWEDQRYMKNLMGKYANCMILNKEHEMFERFCKRWATRSFLLYSAS